MFLSDCQKPSRRHRSAPLSLVLGCMCGIVIVSPASAQIVPDSSLGNESSVVNPNATIKDSSADLIEGGAVRDSNLFHSFSDFNVGDGSAVYFASPEGIDNILTRVTGNNISNIFGTLGVDGAANLFLLNPNGIIFGENATLDLNGSFFATTAESYIFNNDFAYSAANPEAPPLLTVNLPIGVQFGDRAETIVNRARTIGESGFPDGLKVLPENNITLVGGDILFENGHLTASSGQIELGSVAPNSIVTLKPFLNNWLLDYKQVTAWQNIRLTQQSSLDVSGNGSGKMQIMGRQVQLLEGSDIYAVNLGEQDGRTVSIFGSELIELVGGNEEQSVSVIQSAAFADGKGGSVEIETNVLRLINGGQIGTGTSGSGASGNLSVKAKEIVLAGMSPDGFRSGLFTSVGDFTPDPAEATGKGGNLNIETEKLQISDEGVVDVSTSGFGDGGDIFINAREIVVDGGTVLSSTFDQGNSGNIKINTQQLKAIGNAAQISTINFGSGQAGNLTIKATDLVEISGVGFFPSFELDGQLDLFSSGLFVSVQQGATGNGGNLVVETNKLQISEGGKIVANTLGIGDAGDILIRANTVEVKDAVTDVIGTRTGISSNVEASGIGNGGDLNISTNVLEVSRGGSISVDAKGQGNAGNINIDAQNINVSGVSSGEIVGDIPQPQLNSTISAFAQGDYDAGNIIINSNTLEVSDRGNISVSNLGNGNSGNLNITTSKLELNNSATIEAKVNAGSQGNINLATDNIFLSNQSEITAIASNTAQGGNININNAENIVLFNDSQIIADAVKGKGGNIDIMTQGYFIPSDSLVSASSEFGLDGSIEVDTINGDLKIELGKLPKNTIRANQQITASCGVGANQFAISGRGGLPNNPTQNLRRQAVWNDMRLMDFVSTTFKPLSSALFAREPKSIIEAQGWQINNKGHVVLIAHENQPGLILNQADCRKY